MTQIPVVSPQRVGFVPERLERAFDLLKRASETGEVPSAVLAVGRRGGAVAPRGFAVAADTPFLVASLTKPVVAALVLLLIERGRLGLEDRVADFVPEFAGQGKNPIRVRHLLTHTSGLPDMLPENVPLRERHAPLAAFVDGTCRATPGFEPGTQVRYQSMGFTMLGEILHRVSGTTTAELARAELFEPLGMSRTWLGCPADVQPQVARIRLAPEQAATDWNWNSAYWLGLGAPWGGLVTTAADYARFCRLMLDEGQAGRTPLLAPASVRAMTRNQLAGMPDVPDADRRARPWGLGWRLNGPGHDPAHGDLLGPLAYDHWGATGCLCWVDPEADAFAVLLTTKPVDEDGGRLLARVSNLCCAALA